MSSSPLSMGSAMLVAEKEGGVTSAGRGPGGPNNGGAGVLFYHQAPPSANMDTHLTATSGTSTSTSSSSSTMNNNPAILGTQTILQSSQTQPMLSSSMNRSQRCGVCRGCQCKPCGQCTYCQDSPQFGGPGVKKQSCIERRCLRVLENRLQRDAPTFKARVGCNQCEDCRIPDCQICLVCLDKRFFENRYMTGAMCAKKRCNNATSIELPAAQNADLRQLHKRPYEQSTSLLSPEYQMMKRRLGLTGMDRMIVQQQQQQRHMATAMSSPPPPPPSGLSYPVPQAQLVQQRQSLLASQISPRLTSQQQQQQQQQLLLVQQHQHHPNGMLLPSISSNASPLIMNGNPPSCSVQQQQQQQQQHHQQESQQTTGLGHPLHFIPQYHQYMINGGLPAFGGACFADVVQPQSDPFTPPSYAPEMKNAVVLQPL